MIFYGSRGTHLHSEQASGIKCDHCNQQTQHTFSFFGRYAHLYWIPLFPMGKKGVSECNHCKITLAPKEMNDQLKMSYQNAKSKVKTPIWYWSGLFLIGVIIFLIFYSGKKHDKDILTYIDTPMVGDVIEYKPNKYYSTLKIVSISEDSIFVVPNNYEIEKKHKLYKIDKSTNYTADSYGISTNRFKGLFEEKIFLDIDRD